MQRQKLHEPLKSEVDNFLMQGAAAIKYKNNDLAERNILAAWHLLPEPRLQWDFYRNIIPDGLVRFYLDTHQFDKAEKWLEITRQSYGPNRNEVIEFLAATLWFAMGDFDKAFEEFDRQYKAGKTRPFQGQDKKYLDFYLKRVGAKT